MGITGLYLSVFSSVIKSVFPASSIQLIFLFLITISALYFNTISARKYFSSMMILRYFVSRFDNFFSFFPYQWKPFFFPFQTYLSQFFPFQIFSKYHSRPSYQKSLRLSLTLYLPLSSSLSRSLHLMMFVISSSSFLSLSLISHLFIILLLSCDKATKKSCPLGRKMVIAKERKSHFFFFTSHYFSNPFYFQVLLSLD